MVRTMHGRCGKYQDASDESRPRYPRRTMHRVIVESGKRKTEEARTNQVLLDQFTFYVVCHCIFRMIGCPLTSGRCSRSIGFRYLRRYFSLYYFLYVRPAVENIKIDVLSEEPCPLRRGGATGRANRVQLMMCDDKEMTMHAMGPP